MDEGGTLTLSAITVSDGQGTCGGGVFNNGGTVVIGDNNAIPTTINMNVADGAAGSGGGILNDGGTLTVRVRSAAGGSRTVLEFSDDGVGMDARELELYFRQPLLALVEVEEGDLLAALLALHPLGPGGLDGLEPPGQERIP